MNIEFPKVKFGQLAGSFKSYVAKQSAPLDGMWTAFAQSGECHQIVVDERVAGYAAKDGEGALLQFHLEDWVCDKADEVFAAALSKLNLQICQVPTTDALFLNLTLPVAKEIQAHTLLYGFVEAGPNQPRAPLVQAQQQHFEEIITFVLAQLGVPEGWLRGYVNQLIGRGDYFIHLTDGGITATAECRGMGFQPRYNDVGFVVHKEARGKGLGTAVMNSLVTKAFERGKQPICSTEITNRAARRAIEKAGFRTRHRIYRCTLST